MRKVSPAGIITTVAGIGTQGYSGDGGPAGSAQLIGPFGLAVDAAGNMYAVDSGSIPAQPPMLPRPAGVVRLLEPDRPAPAITSITSAASNLAGPIAPGEIVVLYHSGIGPAEQTQFRLNDAGLVGTQLDRTQVIFNGTPAPRSIRPQRVWPQLFPTRSAARVRRCSSRFAGRPQRRSQAVLRPETLCP